MHFSLLFSVVFGIIIIINTIFKIWSVGIFHREIATSELREYETILEKSNTNKGLITNSKSVNQFPWPFKRIVGRSTVFFLVCVSVQGFVCYH